MAGCFSLKSIPINKPIFIINLAAHIPIPRELVRAVFPAGSICCPGETEAWWGFQQGFTSQGAAEMWNFSNPTWFCFAEEVSEEEMSEEEERENGNHIPVGTIQILTVWKKCLAECVQLNKSISANI